VQSQQRTVIDHDAASRALIDLIADLTWAERKKIGGAGPQRTRQEAMALLTRVAHGDREAARRAMELVGVARTHAA
jgi:hypothetical protein